MLDLSYILFTDTTRKEAGTSEERSPVGTLSRSKLMARYGHSTSTIPNLPGWAERHLSVGGRLSLQGASEAQGVRSHLVPRLQIELSQAAIF